MSVSSTHDTNSDTLQPLQSKSDHVPPLVPLTQGVKGCLFTIDRDGKIAESDSDLGMEHLVEPVHVSDHGADKDNGVNEDDFLALERPSSHTEHQTEPPTANSSAVIGDHHDNPSDAASNNNDQKLQSQQSLKPKHQVIKSQLFIEDDDNDYDHDGGISAGGISGSGIDGGGIDSSGINGGGVKGCS
jgi:hypothetical protein